MSQPNQILQTGYYTQASSCHSGNTELIKFPKTGGALCFGGLSHSVVTDGHVVIDLTGTFNASQTGDVKAMNGSAESDFADTLDKAKPVIAKSWLRVPIKDFGVPHNLTREFWDALRDDIYAILKRGDKVVVFCQGGHGRTGMAAAILCWLLNPKAVGEDPIQWVRDRYCHKAVETVNQVKYVHEILGLPEPDTSKYIKPVASYGSIYSVKSTNRQEASISVIANELYKKFVWSVEHDDHVEARRVGGDESLVKLVATSGTSDYVTDKGEVLNIFALMSELEEKNYQAKLVEQTKSGPNEFARLMQEASDGLVQD